MKKLIIVMLSVFIIFTVPGFCFYIQSASSFIEEAPTTSEKVKRCIRVLEWGDCEDRDMAADTLGDIGPAAKNAVPVLIKALKPCFFCDEYKNWEIHHCAIKALGKIGDTSAVLVLIELLKNKDRGMSEAAEALGRIGDKSAVPALIEAMGDRDTIHSATEALGRIGDTSAVPVLLEALKGSEDFFVQREAKSALEKMNVKVRIISTEESNETNKKRGLEGYWIGQRSGPLKITKTKKGNLKGYFLFNDTSFNIHYSQKSGGLVFYEAQVGGGDFTFTLANDTLLGQCSVDDKLISEEMFARSDESIYNDMKKQHDNFGN